MLASLLSTEVMVDGARVFVSYFVIASVLVSVIDEVIVDGACVVVLYSVIASVLV